MLIKLKLLQKNYLIYMIKIEMVLLIHKKVFILYILFLVPPMLIDAYRGMSKAFNPT